MAIMSTGWSFPYSLNVFIADHRRHLNLHGVNNLEDLRTDEDLIQGFQDTLLMPSKYFATCCTSLLGFRLSSES